jgi:hypothetical protein
MFCCSSGDLREWPYVELDGVVTVEIEDVNQCHFGAEYNPRSLHVGGHSNAGWREVYREQNVLYRRHEFGSHSGLTNMIGPLKSEWAKAQSEEYESSDTYGGNAELTPDNWRNLGAKELYGVQHFFVWKRRDTHLECDAGDAAKNFIHVKDLLRDRFRVADEQRAGRSAQSVELSACGGWPAAFLADFGKRVRIAWKKYVRGFVRGIREKANRMKTYCKSLGRMTGAAPSFAVKVYERAEASGFTADNGHHERKSEHSCANERFGRTTYTDPYRQRIL